MPFLLAIVTAAGLALVWYWRAKQAAEISSELIDVANDVRLAARRFGFRRSTESHPVDQIEDPDLAIAALGNAFLELDSLPSRDDQQAVKRAFHRHLGADANRSEELMILGHWLVQQCGGAKPAVARLSRKLYKLDGAGSVSRLMAVIKAASGEGLSADQRVALDDITRALRL